MGYLHIFCLDATVREKAVIGEGGGVRGQGGGQGGGRGQDKGAMNGMPSKKSNSTSQLSAQGRIIAMLAHREINLSWKLQESWSNVRHGNSGHSWPWAPCGQEI